MSVALGRTFSCFLRRFAVSVMSRHRELLQEGDTSPSPALAAPSEESEEDFQEAMMLASSQYRPKDWVTDPLPEAPPLRTVSR